MTETSARSSAGSSVRQRLLRGLGATALGPVVTTFVQVVSVPVFLHFWGTRLYGEWLILSAIPTYLSLTDMGFGSAAGNDMTMKVAAGDRQGALRTFQSMWMLTTIASILVASAVLLGLATVDATSWFHISAFSPNGAKLVLGLLSTQVLLSLQSNALTAGFRCDGKYATGALCVNALRLVEFGTATIVVLVSHSQPYVVALVMMLVRAVGTIVMLLWMYSAVPWLRCGFKHAERACIRELIPPSLAYMAFPAGNALSLQGMVLVVGKSLGPVEVVTFSTMRQLTRFIFHIMGTINNTIWPELSAAYGASRLELARRLHRVACQSALWASLALVAAMAVFGGRIFLAWTHGRVPYDSTVFYCLLAVIVANSFWYTSSVVAIAANKHIRTGILYLSATVASLVAAQLGVSRLGIMAPALSLLIIDLTMSTYVLRHSIRLLEDKFADFFPAMFRIPRLVGG